MSTVAELMSSNTGKSVFDVATYGAKGDGKTDDTAAINKAIKDANEKGGIVLFHAKTYMAAMIVPKDNVTLMGVGKDRTVIKQLSNTNNYLMLGFNVVINFDVMDLTFDGNNAFNPTNAPMIEFRKGYNLTFENVKFRNVAKFYALHLDGCMPTDPAIQYMNRIQDFYNFYEAGIMNQTLSSGAATAGGNLKISGCHFAHQTRSSALGGAAVFLKHQGQDIYVSDCKFTDMADSAVICTSGKNVNLTNLSGDTFGASIWIGSNGVEPVSEGVHVTGCGFTSTNDVALGMTYGRYFTVEGNAFTDCGMEGIFIDSARNGSVIGNTVMNSGKAGDANRSDGISVTDDGTNNPSTIVVNVTFSGNVIGDNQAVATQRNGIYFRSYGDYCTVVGNSFRNNTGSHIKAIEGRQLHCLIKDNNPPYIAIASGAATQTVDWTGIKTQSVEIYQHINAFTFTGGKIGDTLKLIIFQKSVGNYFIHNWGANIRFPGGTVPIFETTPTGACDILTFYCDGTNYYLTEISRNMVTT